MRHWYEDWAYILTVSTEADWLERWICNYREYGFKPPRDSCCVGPSASSSSTIAQLHWCCVVIYALFCFLILGRRVMSNAVVFVYLCICILRLYIQFVILVGLKLLGYSVIVWHLSHPLNYLCVLWCLGTIENRQNVTGCIIDEVQSRNDPAKDVNRLCWLY